MDFTGLILWVAFGALVAGIVGHMRGEMGKGMIAGAILGPLFGTIVIMLMTLRRNGDAEPSGS